MEICHLFQPVICQDRLSRIEKAKQRQGLVPDLRVTVPPLTVVSVGGGGLREDEDEARMPTTVWVGRGSRVKPVLHELRCISSNGSNRGRRGQ